MSDCPRCNQSEQYGCGCTTQEMYYWSADRIAELEAKLAKAEQLINELRYAWSVRDLTQADFHKALAELKEQDDD